MDFSELSDRIKDLFHEKPLVFLLSVLFIFFALVAIIISLIQTSPKKIKNTPVPQSFTPDSAIIVPSEPEIQKDYWPNRTTGKSWTAQEVEEWFYVPDDKAIEELEKANDSIVTDILGAAP